MLKRIYADNYRSLVNFEFQPATCNLLIGDNGSGKSCVFDVIEAIQDIVVGGHGVTDILPTSSLTRWETRDVQRFELQVQSEEDSYDYTLEIEHHRKASTCSVLREQVNYAGKPIYRFESKTVHLYNDKFVEGTSFQGDSRRSFLAIVEERPENQRLNWFLQFLRKIWILRANPLAMNAASRKEAAWLERDGSNFSSWYREMSLQYSEEAESLRNDMREVIEGLQTFRMLSSGGTAKDFVATLAASSASSLGKRYDLTLDELSLGQRALLLLYAILHFAAHRAIVLCLDEPDNFVALREIQPWLVKLSDALQKSNGQLLLISHHPEVIDYLAAGDAFKFERPGGDLTRVRPFLVNLELGLKASECIARGWDDGPSQS